MISYSTEPVISLALEKLELPELNLHKWSLTEIAALDGNDLRPVAKETTPDRTNTSDATKDDRLTIRALQRRDAERRHRQVKAANQKNACDM